MPTATDNVNTSSVFHKIQVLDGLFKKKQCVHLSNKSHHTNHTKASLCVVRIA